MLDADFGGAEAFLKHLRSNEAGRKFDHRIMQAFKIGECTHEKNCSNLPQLHHWQPSPAAVFAQEYAQIVRLWQADAWDEIVALVYTREEAALKTLAWTAFEAAR